MGRRHKRGLCVTSSSRLCSLIFLENCLFAKRKSLIGQRAETGDFGDIKLAGGCWVACSVCE